ncbi:phytanoyl-CoA dioxygenase family protein [Methylopila sp. M107]|uniref:phytanoyl-CoA dioxygenase family protein n=1 Tax=Methylopila sp. M107 TaxID=1101190 RepID=UPI000364AFFC|nr:phytanoyl-CoA dioxygenase family protein [Methylopila sp. M107]
MTTAAAALAADGACVVRGAIPTDDVEAVAAEFSMPGGGPGTRGASQDSTTGRLVAPEGALGRLAAALTGCVMRPVRIVRFDKTAATNWMVPWHQDRTIAVAERAEVDGFGPWSVKDGVVHVEPPVALLGSMLTLRLFLDPCGTDQGPVEIALGSHAAGRVPAGEAAALARSAPRLLATGEAGDVLAMRLLALHASARSRSARRRRVLHVDYAADRLPAPLDWAMG